jgi:hypothetical protein
VASLDDSKPWDRACSEGWEGVIAKRRDAPYEHRRSPHWLKMKCEASQELVAGGFTDPHGGRVGLGALLVGYCLFVGVTFERLADMLQADDRQVRIGRDVLVRCLTFALAPPPRHLGPPGRGDEPAAWCAALCLRRVATGRRLWSIYTFI